MAEIQKLRAGRAANTASRLCQLSADPPRIKGYSHTPFPPHARVKLNLGLVANRVKSRSGLGKPTNRIPSGCQKENQARFPGVVRKTRVQADAARPVQPNKVLVPHLHIDVEGQDLVGCRLA